MYLLNGIRFGFDTLVSILDLPTFECKNLLSAIRDPESVDMLLKQEIDKGYVKGPFSSPPFETYRVSPIGIAEGKYSGKKRLILDLSSPHEHETHESINSLIDKEVCSLSYVKIDDAIRAIKHFGKQTILNKTDMTDAFKQLGIRKDQHHLYCMKWKNNYYHYVRLCFGSRSSPCIFDNLSRAICWIAKENYGIPVILHLLDDFLTIQPPDSCGFRTMALITLIFNRLNIPISKKKTVGPTCTIEYLGIILDTVSFEARLPNEKQTCEESSGNTIVNVPDYEVKSVFDSTTVKKETSQHSLHLETFQKAAPAAETIPTPCPKYWQVMWNQMQNASKGYIPPFVTVLIEAACIVAYFGFLRCGELTVNTDFDASCNLCIEDITFEEDYAILHLKTSKTDPFRSGVNIYLFKNNTSVCPVKSLIRYLDVRRSRFSIACNSSPLFVMENGEALTRTFFINHVRSILEIIGLNPSNYNGHSFRIGAATSVASKIEDHLIKILRRFCYEC
ncbi:unnamed protein product [Mytilus edulis]|uniref:Reverse transcriptase domain-containing protein n=1 Tax=Mytilus edulis TaxID=6550 RepID=A0A8S3SUB8_MYTED|nr:unnamed protein product [Mytilus edulis]